VAGDREDARVFERLGHDLTLREAVADDLDAVSEIEGRAFPFPWPRQAFAQELINEWSRFELVCDGDGAIAGYLVYWVVEDELHVLNIAVDPGRHRGGIGRELMWHIEAVCRDRDVNYITLEVRVSNAAAIALYGSLGFETIHQRKRYYVNNGEDALVMAKVL